MMAPRKLLYFATIVEQGSFNKAAKLLVTSQPALLTSMDGSKPVWAKRSLNAARPVSRRRRWEHCCTLMRVLSGGTVSRRTGADERRAQRRRDLAGYPARSCHQHIAYRRQRLAPDACLAFVARCRKKPTRTAAFGHMHGAVISIVHGATHS
ncbi:LysR family transcriptional regulator [Microvirga sp. SRT01]|uniref:LysR family transcriptional regulator n=1 Tax=Sphingomonas longa TaxID=2778730 RepID=A0ABS2DBG5_9SPHN|nr:LysR family transcriptional regulator [Sphingomonas sp. BT552]MBR7711331.1 LysR family transcriptional regulator [Microvirga sp. SRT01]